MGEPAIDKNTSVHLSIPASPDSLDNPAKAVSGAYNCFGKILIMDDEDFIREIMGDMLKSFGYTVDFARNGQEVLDKLKMNTNSADAFSAVIMDLTIPGAMGGKETIKQLREIDTEVITIVSSGYADDPVMTDPTKYGFTDKIQKPFRKKDLEKVLSAYLKLNH